MYSKEKNTTLVKRKACLAGVSRPLLLKNEFLLPHRFTSNRVLSFTLFAWEEPR